MKPEQIEAWKSERDKGMFRYVLIRGVLSYGLAMFVAMTFIAHRDELSPSFVGLSAVAWTFGGALFGVLMWYVQERRYRRIVGGT